MTSASKAPLKSGCPGKPSMSARRIRSVITALALAAGGVVCAQPVIPGSTAFCLYEVPVDEAGKRRWINLGIVQYVEATRSEVRIFYGAGSFGAGHEARFTVGSMEEATAILEKMRRVAAACR